MLIAAVALQVAAAVAAPPPARPYDRVVVVSFDGMRPDGMERAEAPNLHRLRAEGAYALRAETVGDSSTLPSHSSMLSGVEVRVHGMTFDDLHPERGFIRVRLDAEIIRDAALAASAQLDRRVGGPSVFPPLPEGVMKLGQSDNRVWETSTGPDRFRRGMYTYFWRATPHSSLVVFDAPDALVACTRRTRSNTPLQALTLLNDQAYVEHAQALARRIAEAPMASDSERLDFAFRVCLSRPPEGNEKAILSDLLAKADPALHPEKAWMMVARTLLNLDEFITRE